MSGAPQARMELIRERLASTSPHEGSLRVMLVLAHELLRRDAMSGEAPQAVGEEAMRPTAAANDTNVEYAELVRRIQATVARTIPRRASVLVVSRGDESLFVPGFQMRHFPQGPDGIYAGHYPSDSDAAIAHLEHCRAAGAEFLLLPATGFWWLDYYGGLLQHLLSCGRVVHHDNHCLIFDLCISPTGGAEQ